MSNAKTLSTNKLINSITLRAMLPTTNVTFQEADFLTFINEEMDMGVVPHILAFHEDYLLFHEDIPMENDVERYQIPSRAIGNKLRDITFFDGSSKSEMTRISIEDVAERNQAFSYTNLKAFYIEGDEIVIPKSLATSSGKLIIAYYIRPNTMVSENDVSVVTSVNKYNGLVTVDKYPETFLNKTIFDITSSKSAFRLISKEISPDGIISSSNLNFTFGTQRVTTYDLPVLGSIAPSSYIKIVDNSYGSSIANVFWFDITGTDIAPIVANANIYRINCSACVTTNDLLVLLVALVNNTFLDSRIVALQLDTDTLQLINGGVGISVGDNFTVTSVGLSIVESIISAGTVTIPKRLDVDDIIALPEQTIIPQIPIELHAMLAQRCAMRCLEALGDIGGLQAAQLKLADMEAKTGSLIDNRVESAPLKIVPRHTPIKRKSNLYRR